MKQMPVSAQYGIMQALHHKVHTISERGKHDELLAAGGFYHDLYMSQFRYDAALHGGARASRPDLTGCHGTARHTVPVSLWEGKCTNLSGLDAACCISLVFAVYLF
jgi:hypothetical protein